MITDGTNIPVVAFEMAGDGRAEFGGQAHLEVRAFADEVSCLGGGVSIRCQAARLIAMERRLIRSSLPISQSSNVPSRSAVGFFLRYCTYWNFTYFTCWNH
ncbi:hypothetical protein [Nocardia sp. MW-W600-9]